MKVQSKMSEWLKRYLPAEFCGIIGVAIGGNLTNILFHNAALTAVGGTIGENIGYYGKIVYADMLTRRKKDQKITLKGMIKVVRNTIVEFGVAEYLDLIIRPFCLYMFPKIIGNIFFGLFVGKFAADIIFYIPTIIFYEIRKKFIAD